MGKLVAVVGDRTTKGGYIITGSGPATCGGRCIALVGDLVTCPKCGSKGQIVEGAPNLTFHGKPAAYNGCRVACKCTPVGSNQIIAGLSWMSIDVIPPKSSESTSYVSNPETRSKIRLDVKKLLDLAKEVSEKHLYYEEIKQQFIQAIETFANSIVTQVDNGSISYVEGSEEIQKEKTSLFEQSYLWVKNGFNFFGGIGQILAGVGLCETGIGCVFAAPMVAHGFNGAYEGGAGIYNGVMNQIDGGNRSLEVKGDLRKLYESAAEALGFDASVGSTIYDSVDLAVSVRGKLKLVPKLNEFREPKFKLFFYGRQDLERAYKQMSEKLLLAEIWSDSSLAIDIIKQFNNAFFYNKDNEQVIMVVKEPETITNVGQIVDDCHLVITVTGTDEDIPAYYRCKASDNSEYRKDLDGNIIKVD